MLSSASYIFGVHYSAAGNTTEVKALGQQSSSQNRNEKYILSNQHQCPQEYLLETRKSVQYRVSDFQTA